MRSISTVLIALSALASAASASQEEGQVVLSELKDFVCRHPPYKPQIVSASPLVIYIRDFLTEEERSHLVAVSEGKFTHSAVSSSSGGAARHAARTSQSAYVPRDAVLRCVEDRALAFQGFLGGVRRAHLEPLQLVRYAPGQRFHLHTDWMADAARHATAPQGGNRLSSFFAYVRVRNDTTGGGTAFPYLSVPLPPVDPEEDESWCDIVDCDAPWEEGVVFRPVEGNAVFWVNLLPDGSGDRRVLHAGLPIATGEKMGLNIWTRQGPLSEEARGPEFYPEV